MSSPATTSSRISQRLAVAGGRLSISLGVSFFRTADNMPPAMGLRQGMIWRRLQRIEKERVMCLPDFHQHPHAAIGCLAAAACLGNRMLADRGAKGRGGLLPRAASEQMVPGAEPEARDV